MKMSKANPLKHLRSKSFVASIAICDDKQVQSPPLQSILKNIKCASNEHQKLPVPKTRTLYHVGQGEKPFEYCPSIPTPCPQKLWACRVKDGFIHSALITMTIKVASFPLTANGHWGLLLKSDFL
ncbi:hypothetical protein [Flagellimonas amoyensis]|uniref:hypothetical protein n=1 Tax=Flagellimonas amoyensis TaxID=2169401 RepID=UPI00131F322F|nr:hypothetical protein [Allomuricauda amoyensis]